MGKRIKTSLPRFSSLPRVLFRPLRAAAITAVPPCRSYHLPSTAPSAPLAGGFSAWPFLSPFALGIICGLSCGQHRNCPFCDSILTRVPCRPSHLFSCPSPVYYLKLSTPLARRLRGRLVRSLPSSPQAHYILSPPECHDFAILICCPPPFSLL